MNDTLLIKATGHQFATHALSAVITPDYREELIEQYAHIRGLLITSIPKLVEVALHWDGRMATHWDPTSQFNHFQATPEDRQQWQDRGYLWINTEDVQKLKGSDISPTKQMVKISKAGLVFCAAQEDWRIQLESVPVPIVALMEKTDGASVFQGEEK